MRACLHHPLLIILLNRPNHPDHQRSTTSMGVSSRLSETTKERLLQSGQYQYQVSFYVQCNNVYQGDMIPGYFFISTRKYSVTTKNNPIDVNFYMNVTC